MRRTHGSLLLLAGLLILPNLTWSQGPGERFRKISEKFSADPDAAFDALSGGKEVIVFSELTPKQQQGLRFAASMQGFEITERISREQFKEKATALFKKGFTPPPGSDAPPPGPGSGRPPGKGGPRSEDRVEAAFRRYDTNNDGLLSADEIPEGWQQYREKYDEDHDGFISLSEFKKFASDMYSQGRELPNSPSKEKDADPLHHDQPAKTGLDDGKPAVYRAGKLPKGLPEWFARLDKEGDCDGQVGLWEARNDKSVLENFAKMDLNGDGLLTAEEVLKYMAKQKKPTEDEATVASREPAASGTPQTIVLPPMSGPPPGGFRFNGGPSFTPPPPAPTTDPAAAPPSFPSGPPKGEKGSRSRGNGGGSSGGYGGGERRPKGGNSN